MSSNVSTTRIGVIVNIIMTGIVIIMILTLILSIACGATMNQNNSYAIISSYSTRYALFL